MVCLPVKDPKVSNGKRPCAAAPFKGDRASILTLRKSGLRRGSLLRLLLEAVFLLLIKCIMASVRKTLDSNHARIAG